MDEARIGALVPAAAVAVAVAVALALAGCGRGAGGEARTSTALPAPLAQASSTHERPSPAPPPERPAGAASTPIDAVRAFATLYINWTPDTVAVQMRELAGASIGQARAAMALAAVETAHDYELRQGGISNRGTVEAIAPLIGGSDRYAVITRETTTATNTTAYQGLRPAWHVAIATVVAVPGTGWVVSAWQPEN